MLQVRPDYIILNNYGMKRDPNVIPNIPLSRPLLVY